MGDRTVKAKSREREREDRREENGGQRQVLILFSSVFFFFFLRQHNVVFSLWVEREREKGGEKSLGF